MSNVRELEDLRVGEWKPADNGRIFAKYIKAGAFCSYCANRYEQEGRIMRTKEQEQEWVKDPPVILALDGLPI